MIREHLTNAFRSLRRAPGFSLVVVATLALGIGANAAIFSVVDAVLLRPLNYPAPEQLVRVTSELTKFGVTDAGVAPLELFDYQSRTDVFSGVAGLYPINANVTGGDQPERIEAMIVTWNYFSILGARPQLGRVFGPDDDGPGIPELAVISDGYWRRRLGADPSAIGRSLLIDGDPFVIVGVMPAAFRHPGRTLESEVDVWAPGGYRGMPFGPPVRDRRMLEGAVARLANGVTLEAAQASLDNYAAATAAAFPEAYPAENGWRPRLVPLQDSVVGAVAPPMLMLLGAVGLVLLIACANVANLMLTRSSRRQQEMLVRLSLGATPGRLAGQVFVESAVLAAVAGVAGLFLASWSLRALVALAPSRLPRISDVAIDPMTILVAFGVTALAAVLFGLAPALHARRIGGLLARTAGRGGTASAGAMRLRNGLVAAEVAMAVVLLIGAGLLARTFWALQNVSPGFETTNLVTARVWLPRPNDSSQAVYLNPENRRAFMRAALDRVSALPGVTSAALTTQVPLGGYTAPLFFEIDGRTDVGTTARPVIHNFQVSPGYLETMGIPIRQGRAFDASDRAGSEPVAIISAAAAERFWPGENPVGSRIRISPQAPWTTIVGVAGDVLHRRLDEAPQPILYRPLEQSSNLTLAFVVRTDGSQPGLPQALSEAVRAVDPALPVYAVRSMDELLARGVAQRQFLMRVLVAFGGAAVALALLGIYGVISYAVEQRTREIGIRIAIGARRVQVLGLVLRQGLGATLAGLAAGAAGAIGVARLIASQLYGVAPFDPLTIGGVMGLMLVVAALAILTPARRAANIDPIHALRREA